MTHNKSPLDMPFFISLVGLFDIYILYPNVKKREREDSSKGIILLDIFKRFAK